MAQILTTEVLEDPLAVSLACAVAVANEKAREVGVDVRQSLISITQQTMDAELVWRINYGPKEYVNRRGCVFIVYPESLFIA
jgi:hypothetical protein